MTEHIIFRIKPSYGSNTATFKLVGKVSNDDRVTDEIIELEKPLHPNADVYGKHTVPLKSHDGYDIYGTFYRCNLIDTFVAINKRYPIMYLALNYKKSVLCGSLLQIIISIDINKDDKKKVKSAKNYINRTFSGEFVQHFDCDDELQAEIKNLDKTQYSLSDIEFFQEVINGKKICFKTIKDMQDNLISLCESESFDKLLQLATKNRNKQRQTTMGANFSNYQIPTHISNLGDLKKEMLENNEIIFD